MLRLTSAHASQAACRNSGEDLFVPGKRKTGAKRICTACPIRTECLADALDSRSESGVWGGLTDRERRALLRRRPDVTSWHDLLARARDEYTTSQAS